MVVVTGCFDILHTGHVGFLKRARLQGDSLVVIIGNDENVKHVKGAYPVRSAEDRKDMLLALECVDFVYIDEGLGSLAFRAVLERLNAMRFVVNEDGHTPDKEAMVRELGIEYGVFDRHVPDKSTTGICNAIYPYRINMAGGWIDQPWMSKVCPGSVVNIAVKGDFKRGGGMATSTRDTMMQMYGLLPSSSERHAKLLFGADNPPGTKEISGAQDAIGLTYPGVVRMDFDGEYWPETIEHSVDEDVCRWLEQVVSVRWAGQRSSGYNPKTVYNESLPHIRRLGESGRACWDAIVKMDVTELQNAVRQTCEAWAYLLPNTLAAVDLKGACGLTGAGGGGYAIHIGDRPPDAVSISIRR